MSDLLIQKSHEAREKLVREFGGLEGLCDKLEELDRKRLAAEAAKRKSAKKSAVATKKRGEKRLA